MGDEAAKAILDEMLAMDGGESDVPEPKDNDTDVAPSGEEETSPETPTEVEEAGSAEAEGDGEEEVEGAEEGEGDDIPEEPEKIIENLRRQILELTQEREVKDGPPAVSDDDIEKAKQILAGKYKVEEIKEEAAKPAPVQFVADDDIDEILTKDGLNNLGNMVRDAAVQTALQLAMPIITAEASRVATIMEYSREFYRANPDLVNDKSVVARASARLVKENPNITAPELFEKAAILSRQILQRKPPSREATVKRHEPGFAGTRKSRPAPGQKPQKTVAQEILELDL